MLQAALRSGAAQRRSVFEVFARRLPDGRRYGVVAGTGRLLDALEAFRFDDGRAGRAGRRRTWSTPPTLDWLAGYRFGGSIWGYGEGDCYFPGSPILVVEGTFAEAVLLETLVLSILNHDSAVAGAASRMVTAAHGRPCIEMGSRRTHEWAAVAAARAAYVAGLRDHEQPRGRPVVRRADRRHRGARLHPAARRRAGGLRGAGRRASARRRRCWSTRTTSRPAVRTAVEVAGPGLGAVRLDSGDLLDAGPRTCGPSSTRSGATGTRILVTSDLDEYAIAAPGRGAGRRVRRRHLAGDRVRRARPPAWSTSWSPARTRSAARRAGIPMVSVAKRSPDKVSIGGRKWALRRKSPTGIAEAEVIGVGAPPIDDGDDRPLLRELVADGKVVGTEAARPRPRPPRASPSPSCPDTAHQLSRGVPAIPTVYEGDHP